MTELFLRSGRVDLSSDELSRFWELKSQGYGYKRLAKEFGVTPSQVRTFLTKCGMVKEPAQKRTRQDYERVREEVLRRYAEGESVSQIYKSGLCDHITVYKTLGNLRDKTVKCAYCGEEISTNHTNRKFCSRKCSHDFYRDKYRKPRREKTFIKEGEEQITLPLLIQRDNNVCYLCGGQCDRNDYAVVNGHFSMGKKYPTIEHVVPLSKGGKHSWANVKLAHNACNAIKGGKYDESKVD